MDKKIKSLVKKTYRNFNEFISDPAVVAMCQLNPFSAAISSYFVSSFQQEQYQSILDFIDILNKKVQTTNNKTLKVDILETPDGKRMLGKIFRSITRDNRIEKLEAMANLVANIANSAIISVDEKEIYIDILDKLNSLELLILDEGVKEMRGRTENIHRGLGWEKEFSKFQNKGISKPLFLKSIRTLESNGLINENNATIVEQDKTHFITDFGEQFYNYISRIISNNHII